jgi:hypothetical protein
MRLTGNRLMAPTVRSVFLVGPLDLTIMGITMSGVAPGDLAKPDRRVS